MTTIDQIGHQILAMLLAEFRERARGIESLKRAYEGLQISDIQAELADQPRVDVDLAFKELEAKKLIGTGPMVPFENKPGSNVAIFSLYSKRVYAYLNEEGYKKAIATTASIPRRPKTKSDVSVAAAPHFYAIHAKIIEKCGSLYEAGEYAEAVEKSFKVVRDRLRELTTYETGSEAFGKGKLHVKGAAAANVDADFNQAVKFLTMAVDMFRNEKSHTSDARIDDPTRAHQYLSLSSLALSLLEKAEVL